MKSNTNANTTKKTGIREKMLRNIITPTIIILVIVALVILLIVKASVNELRSNEITAESREVANEIDSYFTKYLAIAEELAANNEIKSLFQSVTPGNKISDAKNFDSVLTTMTNVRNTDQENILVCWLADVDSSQCFEDKNSGYISELNDWDITERSWYTAVSGAGTTILTEPYENSSTGEMVASVISPIFSDSNELLGVCAVDISMKTLSTMMSKHTLGKSGFFMLMTGSGNIMYAHDKNLINTSLQNSGIDEKVINALADNKDAELTYKWNGSTQHGYYALIENCGWAVLSGMPSLEYNEAIYKLFVAVGGFFIIAIIVLFVLIKRIATGIVKPLKHLEQAAGEIAVGNLDVHVDVQSNDEVGAVASAINKTVVRLKEYIVYIDEITEILHEVADGNLRFELKQAYVGEFQKIKNGLENLSERLVFTLHNINETSMQVSGGSEQIADGAQSLADGATSQAAAIEELQASVTEIAEQVDLNAQSANDAKDRAENVGKELIFSNEQMGKAVDAMKEISHCSAEIENIITTIEEIADQTNLLSLNASIEAARAGDMGSGFAVVAGEVGKLAGESMGAVQTSSTLIRNSLEAVSKGTEIVNTAAAQMEQALGHVKSLQELIENIDEASQRQNASIEQIKCALEDVSEVITDNSAMAEESAAASEQLSAQSQSLTELIQEFKI